MIFGWIRVDGTGPIAVALSKLDYADPLIALGIMMLLGGFFRVPNDWWTISCGIVAALVGIILRVNLVLIGA